MSSLFCDLSISHSVGRVAQEVELTCLASMRTLVQNSTVKKKKRSLSHKGKFNIGDLEMKELREIIALPLIADELRGFWEGYLTLVF